METKLDKILVAIEALNQPENKVLPPDDQSTGDVCYTRLYQSDEEAMDNLCRRTGRKKAQIIRMFVSHGLREKLL
jgi:hypothetical protein